MAIFQRVRSRLSGHYTTEDPHGWKFPKVYSISSSVNKPTTVPNVAELRNAFIPAATHNVPKEAFVYPDTSHAAVHLCLLECFRSLRLSAAQIDWQSHTLPSYSTSAHDSGGGDLNDARLTQSMHWDILVRLAATRFSTWWQNIDSVLSHASMYVIRGGARSEVQLSDNYLPPLDVLMVWYALMLDHAEYYRVCKETADSRLSTLCFPWPAIRDAIDRETMEYKLPRAAQNFFKTITEQEVDILKYLENPPAYSDSVAPPFDIDLVTQIHLQQPFIDDSHKLLWIRSPALHGSLQRASFAYLEAQSRGQLGSIAVENLPYGVELFWRTHRLFPARYSACCHDVDFEVNTGDSQDPKATRSRSTEASASYGSVSITQGCEADVCICWICERIRDDAPEWTYDKSTETCDFDSLCTLEHDDVRQIQDDIGFHRAIESNRRARLPLPTRPLTAAEKEAEKLEARKKRDASLLPGIGEYIEILPNGRTKVRVGRSIQAAYGIGKMTAL